MSLIDVPKFEATPLETDPYEFAITPDFVPDDALEEIIADYPVVPGPGSFPPDSLDVHGAFQSFVEEITGPEFRDAVAEKFHVNLLPLPVMCTVRGWAKRTDGKIHTDSATKVISVLVYLNHDWDAEGGRLRLLRRGDSLEEPAREIPPDHGALLVFRRSERSWHGHEPFQGRRRVFQLNWVNDPDVVAREQFRHKVSAFTKSLFGTKKAG